MRVLCRDMKCAIEIEYAKVDGKRLFFTTTSGIQCYTDDYIDEYTANWELENLVIQGYLTTEKLHIKEE